MNNRRLLSDILQGSDREELLRAWESTEAADEFTPLPGGTYVARIVNGDLDECGEVLGLTA